MSQARIHMLGRLGVLVLLGALLTALVGVLPLAGQQEGRVLASAGPAGDGAWPEPPGLSPSAGAHATGVWVAAGRSMLVFGGFGYQGPLGSLLWSYQAASNSWLPLTPSGTPPTALYFHAAVWDP